MFFARSIAPKRPAEPHSEARLQPNTSPAPSERALGRTEENSEQQQQQQQQQQQIIFTTRHYVRVIFMRQNRIPTGHVFSQRRDDSLNREVNNCRERPLERIRKTQLIAARDCNVTQEADRFKQGLGRVAEVDLGRQSFTPDLPRAFGKPVDFRPLLQHAPACCPWSTACRLTRTTRLPAAPPVRLLPLTKHPASFDCMWITFGLHRC